MVFYLVTLLLAIPSPIMAFSEAWAIFIGLAGTRNWLFLAAMLAAGQTIGFTLLYIFGERLLLRWRKLERAAAKLDRERVQANAPWVLTMGALLGFPPHLALCALGPVMRVPYAMVLPITFVGRFIRFAVLAGVPGFFAQYFDVSVLPEWARALT